MGPITTALSGPGPIRRPTGGRQPAQHHEVKVKKSGLERTAPSRGFERHGTAAPAEIH